MSIVLEALEKAQREGKSFIATYIDRVEKDSRRPRLELRSVHRCRIRQKVIIFGSILFIGLIGLIPLCWRLSYNNSTVSVKPVPVRRDDVNLHSVVPVTVVKKILPKRTIRLNITGVLWDEREPIALVNGKFLKVGDEILGAKIIDIQLHEVRFLYKDEEFAISVG